MEKMVQTSDGALLWTNMIGSGPAVALCSGGPGCCDYLAPVSKLIEARTTVVRWEQRGCGRSTADGKYDLATAIRDLETIREASGWKRWTVGGHSWGANLALAYALEFPDRVNGVLYLAGNGAQNDREWHAAYDAGRKKGAEKQPAFAYPHNLEVNRMGNQTWRAFIREPEFLRRVADLDLPVLFVGGSTDIRPWWPVEQLYRLVPRGERHLLQGAGHHLELTHSEELGTILRSFLAKLNS